MLQLRNLQIKNFRCFKNINLEFESSLILIEGDNGTGKTSLLEAMHYLCYLRSFRTNVGKELINIETEGFFIKAGLNDENNLINEVQVGLSGKKRLVKINNKTIQSYKELMQYYRVISLTEDDLELIKGGPENRRSFIDHYIMLHKSDFLGLMRSYKQVLENRNALLQSGNCSYETYLVWTKQLWDKSKFIQEERLNFLACLEKSVNLLLKDYVSPNLTTKFVYNPKEELLDNFELFMSSNSNLYDNELRWKRSLFGVHLDDFAIFFQEKKSRIFASRGQQKLLVALIKVAQIQDLLSNKYPVLFLLDDFMTDFDCSRLDVLIDLLCSLETQLIFTNPLGQSHLKDILFSKGAQVISLTSG